MNKLALLLGMQLIAAIRADVKLPTILSDHAVLQRSPSTHLWGTASPAEQVTVTLGPLKVQTAAGPDGRWQTELDLSHSASGPFALIVAGNNQVVVHDVLVGEVWIASGQSNLESPIARTDATPEEINAAKPDIREFKVKNVFSPQPQADLPGAWVRATPETVTHFSAVGYYFANNLNQALGRPIGIINASWGGTPILPWTSQEALDSVPEFRETSARILKQAADFPRVRAAYAEAFRVWTEKYSRADRPSAEPWLYTNSGMPPDGWKSVSAPGPLAAPGLPTSGVLWIRKTIDLPAGTAGKAFSANLGLPHGFETLFWNGHQVGEVTPATHPGEGGHRDYDIPGHLVLAGKNILAVRLYDPLGPFAEMGAPELNSYPHVPLTGEWQAKVELEFPPLAAADAQTYPKLPAKPVPGNDRPAFLFNAMIHPLLPVSMRGIVWYQGESNAARALQYRTAFPLLIADWRRQWGWEFPFYYCQIASYLAKQLTPGDSEWAELREAQTLALSLPKTGQAVTLDLGEADEAHYRNKRDAGRRLALVALAKTYGQPQPFSGPVYRSMRIEGDKIRLGFSEVAGGLVARPLPATYRPMSINPLEKPLVRPSPHSELQGFMICGADRHWAWADAQIEGDTVVVSSPAVPVPVAVRYAWADNPTCNLYNQAGLPAGSFRTDDFPLITARH